MKLSNFVSALVAAAASTTALSIQLRTPNDQSPFALPGPPRRGIPGDSPITYCNIQDHDGYNPDDDLVEIKSIDVIPNPPAAGQTLKLDVSGVIKQRIEEGAYLHVKVRVGYITLINKTFDFCDKIKEADVGIECPVEPGPLTASKEQDLPSQIPPGNFIVTAELYNLDDVLITCLHTEVSFHQK